VYGRPALAAAISRGVTATAARADADVLRIAPWGVTVAPSPDAAEPLARALAAVLACHEAARPRLAIDSTVALPGGGGLGCSAALGVAIAGAIDEALGLVRGPVARAEVALAWERIFHGNPSGVDTTVSAHGGLLLFRRGEQPVPIVPARPLRLVIGHSGEASSTKRMVEDVARQHARARARVDETFDAIAALVVNGKTAAVAGDAPALGRLMDLNHSLLASLLLSTSRLEDLCAAARAAGALGAKLTGAGGGGCMIALVDDDATEARVLEALRAAGADAFATEAGA
jgi:mevalonate kinase